MFILQMAHVPRFFSWPNNDRFLGVCPRRSSACAHSINMPPEPHVGSYTRIVSDGWSSSTMSRTTIRGV
jgi:hypothetical protein